MSCNPVPKIGQNSPLEFEWKNNAAFLQIDPNMTDEQKELFIHSQEFQSVIQNIKSQPDKFELNHLIETTDCCAFLNYKDEELFEKIGQQLEVPNRLRGFNPDKIIKLIAAYDQFKFRNQKVFSAIAHECVQQKRLCEFKTNILPALATSYYNLHFHDPIIFKEIARELMKKDRAKELNLIEITVILSIYSDFRFKDPKLFKSLGDALVELIEKNHHLINVENLAKIAFSFAEMLIKHDKLFESISNLCTPDRLRKCDVNFLACIFFSFVANKYYYMDSLKNIMDCLNEKYASISDKWLVYTFMAIKLCQLKNVHNLSISPDESLVWKIYNHLKQLKCSQKERLKKMETQKGWDYAIFKALSKEEKGLRSHFFAEFCFVDIAIVDKKICILLDKRSDYLSDGYNIGTEQIRTLLLSLSGWKVFRLSKDVWKNTIFKTSFQESLAPQEEASILELIHEMPDYDAFTSKRNLTNLYAYRFCFNCFQKDLQKVFLTCTKCHVPLYCSKKCAKEYWKGHKKRCNIYRKEENLSSILLKIEDEKIKEVNALLEHLNAERALSHSFKCAVLGNILKRNSFNSLRYVEFSYIEKVEKECKLFLLTNMLSLFPNFLRMIDPKHKIMTKMSTTILDRASLNTPFKITIEAIKSCQNDYNIACFINELSSCKEVSKKIVRTLLGQILENKYLVSAEAVLSIKNIREMLDFDDLKNLLDTLESETLQKIAEEKMPHKIALIYNGKFSPSKLKTIKLYESLVDNEEPHDMFLDFCLNHRFYKSSLSGFRFDEYTDFELLGIVKIKEEVFRISTSFERIDPDVLRTNLSNMTSSDFLNISTIDPFEKKIVYLLSKIIGMVKFLKNVDVQQELFMQMYRLANSEYKTPACYISTFIEICMSLEMLCYAYAQTPKIAKGLFRLYRALNCAALGAAENMVNDHYGLAREDMPFIMLHAKKYLSQKINFLRWKRYYEDLDLDRPEGIEKFPSSFPKKFEKNFKSPISLYKFIDFSLSRNNQIELIPLLLNHMPENTVALKDTLSNEEMNIAKDLLNLEEELCTPRNIEYLLENVSSKYNLYNKEQTPKEDLMIKPQAFIHLLKAMNIITRRTKQI